MARVFLTGGSGFIGGALIERLRERGDQSCGLARSDVAARVLAERGAEVVARQRCWTRTSMAAGMRGLRPGLPRGRPEHPLPEGPRR